MKRSEMLAGLSREHHGALSLALRARRAAQEADSQGMAATGQRVRTAFFSELRPHFEEEELRLLPVLARGGRPDLVARTLDEHAALAAIVESLAGGGAPALLAFADLLSRHVRFEERELFPALEALAAAPGAVPHLQAA